MATTARTALPGLENSTFDARRVRLASAVDAPLVFGAVREDPLLEIEALRPAFDGRLAVVSSGGCTALSLLAAGARDVVAVDLNATQNHLLELKHAAVRKLQPAQAAAFLGLDEATKAERRALYARLRDELGAETRTHWDRHQPLVAHGVHHAGRSEAFIRVVAACMRLCVHSQPRVLRLLACASVEEQRALYAREWNSRRWRLLYRLLLNRLTLRRAFGRSSVAHVPERRFDLLFLDLFERALTTLPVADNYFLHEMLTGRYGRHARPPYLSPEGAARLARGTGRLTQVDGGFADFLRTQPDGSLDGLALSNICEWLDERGVKDLFAQIARVARPGAVVVFRNFLGFTQVPERWHGLLVEDRARGEALIARDRSLLQHRIVVCRVPASHAPQALGATRVRAALPADNPALLALAARCPMEGELTLCVERAPDFFALSRLEGVRTQVFVAEHAGGVSGCISVAERSSYVNGRPARTLYVSDLKVAPEARRDGTAQALTARAHAAAAAWGAARTPILVTVLAGNRAMERRLDGPRGTPALTRCATLRSLALPALRRRRTRGPWAVAAARSNDLGDMFALWTRVAPGRQFATAYTGRGDFARHVAGPGLASYRALRDARGRLRGFLAVWEQSRLKQLRVLSDSPRLRRARAVLRLLAPLLGLPSLPRPGEALRCATVFGMCVPADEPQVLALLLREALAELRASGIGFLNLGLDERDPLNAALRGLFGQPTRVHAYVATPSGGEPEPFDSRPLHYEIALV